MNTFLPPLLLGLSLLAQPPAQSLSQSTSQSTGGLHAEAERLARAGARADALRRFQVLVEQDPHDVEARVWVGRLQLWLGQPREAAGTFTAILDERADVVDAIIGLAGAQAAQGQIDRAIATLADAERLAPRDADVLAALGRAHRLAGHITPALQYFVRAAALNPTDADIRDGLEQARRLRAHSVELGYFGEDYTAPLSGTANGDVGASVRLDDGWRLLGRMQTQRKFGATDTRIGGGVEWRARRDITVTAIALFGGDAVVLPKYDAAGELRYTRGAWELTGQVRRIAFPGTHVWILAPGLTYWLSDRWAVGGRFFRAETSYASRSAGSVGSNSGALQTSVRAWPRVWLTAAYARGNETFETLSPDRVGRFSADTIAGGTRFDLPSLTSLSVGVERQWRHAGDVRMVRVTAGVAQRF